MAQRGAWTPDKVRQRIQVSMLMKRLTDHVRDPEKHKLTMTQFRAIELLLRKSIPDLASVELSGNADAPIGVTISPTDAKL